jgi:hypothetical protein
MDFCAYNPGSLCLAELTLRPLNPEYQMRNTNTSEEEG